MRRVIAPLIVASLGSALVSAGEVSDLAWPAKPVRIIEGTTVQLPFVRSGKLRALAVTSPHRSPALPGVPTMAEAAIPGYDFQGWVGIVAPAGTPAAIIDRLYREIAVILATPEAREWFAGFGLEPGGETPRVFADLVRDEYAKWGVTIRETGIKAE